MLIVDAVFTTLAVIGVVGVNLLIDKKPRWFGYTDSTTWELIKKGEKK